MQYEPSGGTGDTISFGPTALYYHQKAISSVRRQLAESPSSVPPDVIAAVGNFLWCATASNALGEWEMQRRGLLQLIAGYNGGLDALAKDMLCHRLSLSW